jgi:hypothetical protein
MSLGQTPKWAAALARVMFLACRAGRGEVFEHLAGDGAFEQTPDVFFGATGGQLADGVVAGAWVVGPAD